MPLCNIYFENHICSVSFKPYVGVYIYLWYSLGITVGISEGVRWGFYFTTTGRWYFLVYLHPYHPNHEPPANTMNITLVKRLYNITYVVLTGERELPLSQTMMDSPRGLGAFTKLSNIFKYA